MMLGCLATETDGPTDKKTRKRAEDAAADQAKHGDSCSARRVDAGPTRSTSFGIAVKPLALPRRDDVLVNKEAEAPKPHFSPVEMRMLPSAAGGQIPASIASTAMRTISPQPLFSWSLGETKKSTSRKSNQLAPPAGGGLFEQNQGKLWCSILAVAQVVYGPSNFWEGGACCFVGRFLFGRRMVPDVSCRSNHWTTQSRD